MAKLKIPEVLPVNPVTLACPYCKAKPGYDCLTTARGNPLFLNQGHGISSSLQPSQTGVCHGALSVQANVASSHEAAGRLSVTATCAAHFLHDLGRVIRRNSSLNSSSRANFHRL